MTQIIYSPCSKTLYPEMQGLVFDALAMDGLMSRVASEGYSQRPGSFGHGQGEAEGREGGLGRGLMPLSPWMGESGDLHVLMGTAITKYPIQKKTLYRNDTGFSI